MMRIDQLMSNGESEGQIRKNVYSALGILSKTLAPSPVVRWILPARIRHRNKDDVVIIGEDFITIAQIEGDHRLTPIATKADFDCTIVSAKILGDPVDDDDEDLDTDYDIKVEDSDQSVPATSKLPPQCLVLALSQQQLVFMFACEDSHGVVRFNMSSTVPLPAFSSLPQRLGRHLAIDPGSRAIAVAAAEDNVVLYSAEPINPNATWGVGFLPISCERPLTRVRGTILLMEFLHPPESDPDHVILLLVVLKDGKTCLVRVDWLHSAGVQSAQKHKPYPISKGFPLPNMLIAIVSSAAFILASRSDILLYTGILTGHVQSPVQIELPEPEPKRAGRTADFPRWTAWARPRRTQGPGCSNNEYLYLAREDGAVYYIVLNRDSPAEGAFTTHVKDFACFIDTGFACYGTRKQNDVFAIMGDMSQGGVYTIVPLPISPLEIDSDLISVFPNWTPTFDLIAAKLSRTMDGTTRLRDGLFATGGRQPYGRLSELRFGIEACASGKFHADMLPGVVRIWPLPIEEREDLLILMTSPTNSYVFHVPPGALSKGEDGEVVELEGDVGFDLRARTIAAAVFHDNYILQITERGFSVSHSGLSTVLCNDSDPERQVLAAAIDEEHGIFVTSTRRGQQSIVDLIHMQADENGAMLVNLGTPTYSEKELISVVIFESVAGMFAVFGTSDSALLFYGLDQNRGAILVTEHVMAGAMDSLYVCDDMAVLSHHLSDDCVSDLALTLLCGLRNGKLLSFELLIDQDGSVLVQPKRQFNLGFTSIKISPDYSTRAGSSGKPLHLSAYATCGIGFYKISQDEAAGGELIVSNVWLTDAKDSSLSQGAITGFAAVPSSDLLIPQFSQSLVLTSGDTAYFAKVEQHLPRVLPRSLPVEGTPNRALYSHYYGCFVTVAVETCLQPSLVHRGHKIRYSQPVVHFKSSGPRKWEYAHRLDPGMRVYAIIEWVYRDPTGKKYPYILLGSGPDALSSTKGEVTLLHPILRDGAVQEVRARRAKSLDSAIYSLASYGERGVVICTKPWLYLFEYQLEGSRFVEVCKYRFTSPGVFVTAAPPMIHVSTAEDSLITLLHNPQQNSLTAIGTDAGSRRTAHHLTIDIPGPLTPSLFSQSSTSVQPSKNVAMNLFSTKDCQLVGKMAPSATERRFTTTIPDLFKANLSRSQVRLKFANIRPLWKLEHVPGIIEDRLVGIATDGTISGFAVLEAGLTNRLKWVQRLCERSKAICPMAVRHPSTNAGDDMDEDEVVALPPPGFEGYMTLGTMLAKPEDMHINGDILQRLLDRGGAVLLTQILKEEAMNRDRVADWIRANMNEQLDMVETLVAEVKQALDRWW